MVIIRFRVADASGQCVCRVRERVGRWGGERKREREIEGGEGERDPGREGGREGGGGGGGEGGKESPDIDDSFPCC
jgi:hypothetical protein